MVLRNKHVKGIQPKIRNHLSVLIFKDAKIVMNLQLKSLEIKETVGLNRHIIFGEFMNMEEFKV
jgi:hypothetical protein